eukprot:TRINITY_DN714_c0_g1_i10.p1 TRINITY_DN714_c0_g1~~TRINITY_DN714_c0_g1_i10.p1  ORF type:complete len:175 (-),score=13.72 TRINITY_DN714_c0_g1_i10:535-1059(-)
MKFMFGQAVSYVYINGAVEGEDSVLIFDQKVSYSLNDGMWTNSEPFERVAVANFSVATSQSHNPVIVYGGREGVFKSLRLRSNGMMSSSYPNYSVLCDYDVSKRDYLSKRTTDINFQENMLKLAHCKRISQAPASNLQIISNVVCAVAVIVFLLKIVDVACKKFNHQGERNSLV